MTNFVSVATSAARFQDISLNPQKLAGQCAKLKCCLNYEVDSYVECVKQLPSKEVHLETTTGTYYFFKSDIFKKELTYSTDKNVPANLVTISAERAFEIIALNKNGVKPDDLRLESERDKAVVREFGDILGQDSVTRFDKKKKKKKNSKRQFDNNQPKQQERREQQNRQPKQDGSPKQNAQQPAQQRQQRPNKPKNPPKGPRQNSDMQRTPNDRQHQDNNEKK